MFTGKLTHACELQSRYNLTGYLAHERSEASDTHLAGPALLLWLIQHDHIGVLLGTAFLALGVLLHSTHRKCQPTHHVCSPLKCYGVGTGFLVLTVHIVHGKQSRDYSVGRADSHVPYVIGSHVRLRIDCSVQCAVRTRSLETTVRMYYMVNTYRVCIMYTPHSGST